MPRDDGAVPVGLEGLQREVSSLLHRPLHSIRAVALGVSSRETPWRIEVETARGVERLLVRFAESCSANEVAALEAMDGHPLPTPKVLLWDKTGTRLGIPLFVSSYIDGEPLLVGMKADEPWAGDLYIDTVCAVQSIAAGDLPPGSMDRWSGPTPPSRCSTKRTRGFRSLVLSLRPRISSSRGPGRAPPATDSATGTFGRRTSS